MFSESMLVRHAAPAVSNRLLAAVDSNGMRHLLVPLEADDAVFSDTKSRGIQVTTREMKADDGPPDVYLDLICREATGFDVFDALGGELALALSSEEAPATAVKRLLGKWRRFWLAAVVPSLSREQQIGLFAELWFLRHWLIRSADQVAYAIEHWTGPLGARHDFQFPALSIEAKASTAASSRRHHIHGFDQLDRPGDGVLFVFSLALRDEVNSKHSLPELVEEVRELALSDETTIVRFESRLSRSGYTPTTVDPSLRLRVLDERLYRVSDKFPKLVRETFLGGVPSGVEDITYTVNLDGFDSLIEARNASELGRIEEFQSFK